jgi:hypothetical protein
LREAGRQAEAFALKRKFNQLADQYESMLYQ